MSTYQRKALFYVDQSEMSIIIYLIGPELFNLLTEMKDRRREACSTRHQRLNNQSEISIVLYQPIRFEYSPEHLLATLETCLPHDELELLSTDPEE